MPPAALQCHLAAPNLKEFCGAPVVYPEISLSYGAPVVYQELARPTIAEAFTACVERGADFIIVSPYFLAPGRHWSQVGRSLQRIAQRPAVPTVPAGLPATLPVDPVSPCTACCSRR